MDREELLAILKEVIEQQLDGLEPEDVEVYEEYADGSVAYRLVVSAIETVEAGA